MAKRIQRTRRRGAQLPPGTLYVGRPSKWGNPYHVGQTINGELINTREKAVALFREYAERRLQIDPHWLTNLRGADLACWCRLDDFCHADVLLELLAEQGA